MSIKKELLEKAKQIEQGVSIIAAKYTDWQMIKKYLTNRLEKNELSESQQKLMKQIQFAHNELMSCKYTEREIVSLLQKTYEISDTTAYRIITQTKEIFSEVLSINKAFELKVELESARTMKRKCEEVQDFKTAALIQKNIVEILKQIEIIENIPGDMFEGHEIIPDMDPSLIGAKPIPKEEMTALLKRISIKRGRKFDVEDIDFELIP